MSHSQFKPSHDQLADIFIKSYPIIRLCDLVSKLKLTSYNSFFYVWGIKLLIHHFGKWCCWCYSSGKWLYFWAKFCALYVAYNGDFKIAMRKSIGLVYALCPQKTKIVHTLCNINEKCYQFKFFPHIRSNWI